MGLCGAKLDGDGSGFPKSARDPNETMKSDAMDQKLHEDWKAECKVKKLLLLGAGESGKSTLFKQARSLYGEGFNEEDRLDYCSSIAENILSSMKTLIQQCELNGLKFRDGSQTAAEIISKIEEHDISFIDPDLGRCIEILWADLNIQEMFQRRNEFQLYDSIRYFCKEIKRIARPGYIPTFQDVLMARRTTMGVTEMSVFVKGNSATSSLHLKFVDVGGQRSQRPKWLHQFQVCDSLIYVVAINEYDQVLFEDNETNRVHESIYLFDVICQNKEIRNMNLILFLNKRDLFEEKLLKKKVPLTECFPEYTGGLDLDHATEYIKQKFGEKNTNPHRDIYFHVTCATDTDQIKVVLDVLTTQMIDKLMKDVGFLQ
jgi:GTPase SAR1 family protein